MLKEIEQIARRDIPNIDAEIHYGVYNIPEPQKDKERLLKLVISNSDSTVYIYPETVSEILDQVGRMTDAETSRNCELCHENSNNIDVYRVKSLTIRSHEQCIDTLKDEISEFCKNHPEIVAENL